MTIFLFLILTLLNQIQASDAEIETLFKEQSDNLVQCSSLGLLTTEIQDNVKQRDILKIDYERLFYGLKICQISLKKCDLYYAVLDKMSLTLESIFEQADEVKNREATLITFPLEFITRSRSQVEPLLTVLRKVEEERVEELGRQDYSGTETFTLKTPSDSSIEYLIYVPSLNVKDLTWGNIKESFDAEKRESLKNKLALKQKELSEAISHNRAMSERLELASRHKNSFYQELLKRYGELKEKMSRTLGELS